MLEHQLQNEIIAELKVRQIPVFRQNSGKFQDARTGTWIQGQERGCADIICGYKMQDFMLLGFIEVKSSTGKLSDDQIRFFRTIIKQRCEWLIASDVMDLDRWLKDRTYHGDTKFVTAILDEDRKFIPTQIRKTAKQKMSFATMREFNTWSAKK